jgi:MarR family transcriptional regulator, organic hydroperoxide resistance regulator
LTSKYFGDRIKIYFATGTNLEEQMDIDKGFDLQGFMYSFIDEFKFLFFPEQWSSSFLDYSKNEVLALLYLYRDRNANMTQIAEYINAPLNTATGVVTRLEKKQMVERVRSSEDRRIVQITLTKKAKEYIEEERKYIEFYFKKIYGALTEEEIATAFNIFMKVKSVLNEAKNSDRPGDNKAKKVKKITIE